MRCLGHSEAYREHCSQEGYVKCHVKYVPCHHGMERPQVAGGREDQV
jgi:hypothetical protein